jgi:transcriptional regulator with XRE-family HTH domain
MTLIVGDAPTVGCMDNRTEMREFLASRRAKIRPEDVGLPAGGSRRVPGLRREELAALAGVSVSWYTRLERGDAVGASDAVLDAIARTLRLDDVERRHLSHLTRGASGSAKAGRRRTSSGAIRGTLQLVLDQMTDMPAVIQNDRTDILAVNALGRALYSGLIAGSEGPWNHARYIHLDAGSQRFYPEWEQIADFSVAMLHAAAARNSYDRELTNLIGELATRSEDFRVRWAAHDVHEHQSGVKKVHHEVVGDMSLIYQTLVLPGEPGLTMYLYTAEPGSPSADALRLLSAWSAPMHVAEAIKPDIASTPGASG